MHVLPNFDQMFYDFEMFYALDNRYRVLVDIWNLNVGSKTYIAFPLPFEGILGKAGRSRIFILDDK